MEIVCLLVISQQKCPKFKQKLVLIADADVLSISDKPNLSGCWQLRRKAVPGEPFGLFRYDNYKCASNSEMLLQNFYLLI